MPGVNVMVEAEAPAEEVAAVEALLRSRGVAATVTARLGRYAGGPAPWAMAIEVDDPAFFDTLAAAAGTERGEALAALVADVYELRRRPDRPDGSIRIEDGERSVVLTAAVTDAGMRQVADGELGPGSSFLWDDGEWLAL